MFVGHGMVAFALVGLLARRAGWRAERALSVALVAALFATVPDVDILYGPVGLLGGVSGVFDAAEAFWAAGNTVHRGPTHAWTVGLVAAVAAGLWRVGRPSARAISVLLLSLLVAVATVASGGLVGVVVAAFATAVVGIATLAGRWNLSPRAVAGAAAVGLLSHPLGDLFTGEPPALLYPLDPMLVTGRIALSADPTLHLLGAFLLELSTIWLAVAVYFRLTGRSLSDHADRRSITGVAYGLVALAIPAPTLDTSYHFVLSVLALGAVGFAPAPVRRRLDWSFVVTALLTVTLAGLAYTVAYVVL
ncbi:MAG: metal-dependent hydrolase [Haloarculaceae archaeon]